ncbi:XXYS1_4_G0028860.mRNA.1.CDS.1 [Saccharomyces cerevisiae]|nr:XXYS1_4_G0028860.mRNA.1.CDS.1 [Saccharomyces cerevisiae]
MEDSNNEASDDFNNLLNKEIESAKEVKLRKFANKNNNRNENSSKVKDASGFRLRVIQTDGHKTKKTDPDYEVTIDGPLRKIEPYFFTYKTFCKERWRDRKLVDVFVSEFRDREPSYYSKTIAEGKVYLNDEPANLDTIIRDGDLITHKVHRHEPPVTSKPIDIVFEDEDILVIDKPSSIPVHPTGRYRFNTITKMLERQLGYSVHPCNRLDKPTSGLMFLAKTPLGADRMGDQMKAREVTKEYVARVKGEFPIGIVEVDKPVRSVNPKVALNAVCEMSDENAKHAKTVFQRVSYDGQTSIVKCKPLTGRTHQIRVHLQYLGFPIANDPIYSNPDIWGPDLGRGGLQNYDDIVLKLDAVGKTKPAESWIYPHSEGEYLLGRQCEECEAEMYTDPGTNDLDLWLHAFRYESLERNSDTQKPLWSYRTKYPEWALEPHRRYMEMAVKESDKCGPTKTAFSVGAVLVHGTQVLATGYSRELPGNTHAEQCALIKYSQLHPNCPTIVPMGTVLYTTMEPCSFRLSGNEPCCDRILATQGAIGTVFVGVMEPDTFVKNNTSLNKLESHGVNYIQIPGYEEECTIIAFKGHDNSDDKA